MNKYPAKISTMIEAEIVAKFYPLSVNEIIEHVYNDKKYVLYLGIFILDCLVFNFHGVLIDSYSFESSGKFYNGKSFSDWMIESQIYNGEF